MNYLIVVRVIEHAIGNAVFVDKLCNLFLFENEFHYFFELIFDLRCNTVNVNEKIFAFEMGSSQIEEKSAEGKADPRFVGTIQKVDEFSIAIDLSFVIVILVHPLFVGVKNFLAQDF